MQKKSSNVIAICIVFVLLNCICILATAQLSWRQVNTTLPAGIKLFVTLDSLDGKPNKAAYIIADLQDKNLVFDVDTTLNRKLTPQQYFEKNGSPYVIVNGTFFALKTGQNLNTVIKNGKAISFNVANTNAKDSTKKTIMFRSALGIAKNRKADVAWISSDTAIVVGAAQKVIEPIVVDKNVKNKEVAQAAKKQFSPWNMQTAIGGGPVLLQNGELFITNNQEKLFAGKAINDKHPRTAMGYTKNGKLIILVVEGRNPGIAEGADLNQLANILKSLGCVEALNLDGGGSSCMLVNGKETIKPSDVSGQRPVPAVFLIRGK
jgi:exopolysaccharide biosynthesis protein